MRAHPKEPRARRTDAPTQLALVDVTGGRNSARQIASGRRTCCWMRQRALAWMWPGVMVYCLGRMVPSWNDLGGTSHFQEGPCDCPLAASGRQTEPESTEARFPETW